jgi:phospholipase C
MRFWDDRDLPFTYSLARHFPLGQRYFCSVLAQTYPNRRFFFTATASGTIATDSTTFEIPAANDTIWDRLDAHDIDWAIYFQNLPSWVIVPGSLIPARAARQRPSSQFLGEVAAGKLPQFTFLDPDYNTTSEENPQDIEVGQRFIAQVVDALIPRADLAQDGALHHLRRAWRLLRPRAAAARDQARFDPTDAQPGRRPRR